ncbi:homoserine kinase [Caldibacillus thermoamylovorans]|uniref:homoserine kinase n=1 Tax=Caldibacillus thermoamylovorans TaxID=35841 RepID=UPI001D082062|nr:homoserine kinase [Caldibacillus thermoamylovorans]MCB5935337.1 homoserine kinase [Bacillus sp. DFI.2.34]MCB7077280.1 homoserine kinase [Caldibacillus thermoamylovorans]
MDDYDMYVKVPASTANLGPGFDSVGMALQLYTTLKVKQSNRTKFYLVGDNQENIPTDKSNLIYQTIDFLYKKAGLQTPELEIEVETDIPLARGLGSSGTAIVGGLVAANVLAGEPFSKQEIFQFASEMEGHPDNVGASLFGGIIVAAKNELGDYAHVPLSPPKGLKIVVAIPDFELPTKLAREVLPDDYSRQDVVHALSHSALLVAAIAKGDLSALQVALEDRIHQPYRMALLPGFEELQKNCRNYGAFGTVISGAGPTILAFTTGDCTQLVDFMEKTLQNHGVSAKVMELAIDTSGTTCSVLLKK